MSHPVTPGLLYRWLWKLVGRLAFNRIAVIAGGQLPATGPTLFVATHRNGALDAAAYHAVAPCAVPMVSAQLHRLPLGRFLFQGIAVARDKDRERGIEVDNEQSMRDCIALLQAGGQLFIMPEGTSTLGPRHLPYHRGAARILRAAMDAGVMPTIVPVAAHYEDPTTWQSRVEVLVGEPVYPLAEDKVADLHRKITQALQGVGANFADEHSQQSAERLAYASTLGTGVSYARTLKNYEAGIPDDLRNDIERLQALAMQENLLLHQGVPLVPIGSWWPYALYWLALAPMILLFVLFNAPVLAAGHIASRKLPDAPNVVSFWRMAVGLPAGFIWASLVSLTLAVWAGTTGLALYWGLTIAGILAWYRFRKLSVALGNALLHADSRPALLQACQDLAERNSHAGTA